MPVALLAALTFAAITLLAVLAIRVLVNAGARKYLYALAVIPALVTALLAAAAALTQVPTMHVGIVTSYGRTVAVIPNGLHPKWPWQHVTDLDISVQTDTHTNTAGCVSVRLANQAAACVDTSVRWRINPEAATELYRDYHTFPSIRTALVTRELTSALNDVFGALDPLAGIGTINDIPATSLDTLATAVTVKLQSKTSPVIEVLNVTLPMVRYDPGTEDRIRQFQTALADTRIARQREETTKAEAKANAALAETTANTGVLTSKCLDFLEAARKSNYALPPGLSCWPAKEPAVVITK